MLAFLARTLSALALSLAFAQGAEFTQQYLQRLGGAADALRGVVMRFDAGAVAAGLSRETALDRLIASPDRFVARQGSDMAETIAGFEAIERRYAELTRTPPAARPFVALADPDWAVMRRAAADFAPALPAGPGGLVLTFLGFVLGWLVGATGEGVLRLHRRRRERRRVAVAVRHPQTARGGPEGGHPAPLPRFRHGPPIL